MTHYRAAWTEWRPAGGWQEQPSSCSSEQTRTPASWLSHSPTEEEHINNYQSQSQSLLLVSAPVRMRTRSTAQMCSAVPCWFPACLTWAGCPRRWARGCSPPSWWRGTLWVGRWCPRPGTAAALCGGTSSRCGASRAYLGRSAGRNNTSGCMQ